MLKRKLIVFGLWAVLAVPGWAAQPPFSGIVVFGTSLSDPGNAFALRGGTNTPHDYSEMPFLVPDVPYAKGGHRFTNGATWVEQFARPLGLAGSVRPAFRGSNGATNYAVGASRARSDGVNVSLSDQVGRFLEDTGDSAPSNALYVIEMGSNDIRDALAAGGDTGIIAAALGAIGNNIVALYQAGARKFLLLNAPDISLTPAVRAFDALFPELGAAAGAAMLTQGFNLNLDGVRTQLTANLPGIQIVPLYVYQKLNSVVANPAAFDLTEVQAACITPNAPFHCNKPDDYLFWDGIHPTKEGHAILAQEAAFALTPVAENP
jgi:phospholipase/lecithinase/hemolysin